MLCQHCRAYTPCRRAEVYLWMALLGIYLGEKKSLVKVVSVQYCIGLRFFA